MSQQIGLPPNVLLDLVYLATNMECRDADETAAMETAARKLDFQEGFRNDDGPVLRDVRETAHSCEKHGCAKVSP